MSGGKKARLFVLFVVHLIPPKKYPIRKYKTKHEKEKRKK
jgi:hypothetical protein